MKLPLGILSDKDRAKVVSNIRVVQEIVVIAISDDRIETRARGVCKDAFHREPAGGGHSGPRRHGESPAPVDDSQAWRIIPKVR